MRIFLLLFCCFISWSLPGQDLSGLKFIENKNQWPADVDFMARIPGGNMEVHAGKFRYTFLDKKRIEHIHHQGHEAAPDASEIDFANQQINGHTIEVSLEGANEEARVTRSGRSSSYHNFFLGTDSCRWASGVYAFDEITYGSIYPGIDLKVYSKGINLKYDFVVAGGADPDDIKLHYEGAESVQVSQGDVVVTTSLGELIEKKPVAFQVVDGVKRFVPCVYRLANDRVSFFFPEGYDPCYELVIDPLLIFSTYSGSKADNWGSTATPGERGTLYSAGVTNQFYTGRDNVTRLSGEFPATVGAFQTSYGGIFDIGILKYDSTGRRLLYASYLGGESTESPHSLLVNASDELIVLGTTTSSRFPVTAGTISDTFNGGTPTSGASIGYENGSDIIVARISGDGKRVIASTYLGGTGNDGLTPPDSPLTKNYGDEMRGDIQTDAAGNIFISSVTASEDFPVANAFDNTYNGGPTDAVVLKLNNTLTNILWGAFIGGDSVDTSNSIKLDKNGDVFVAGGTASANFPTTGGAHQTTFAGDVDGWIAKIKGDGSQIVRSTLVGTPSFDQVYFLDLNSSEEVYVYGQTTGSMPITAGAAGTPNSGQFLKKFSNNLSQSLLSTTFGSGSGVPDISPTAFLVSDCNTIYMSGWGGEVNWRTGHWPSTTQGLFVTPDAYQSGTSGSDFYFIVMGNDAKSVLYATYLGGPDSKTHVDGGTSRFDKEGVVYHSVCSGCDAFNNKGKPTSDFPVTQRAWSTQNRSLNCNNAAFKFDLTSLKARLNIAGDNDKICLPDKFRFVNRSSGGEIFYWDFGDGTTAQFSDSTSQEHEYKQPGEYTVRLVVRDPATCVVSDTAYVKVFAYISLSGVGEGGVICEENEFQLEAYGGASYQWKSTDNSFASADEDPVVQPVKNTTYIVDILEASGCTNTDTVKVDVIPKLLPDFDLIRNTACTTRPYVTVTSNVDSLMEGDLVFFDFGDGTTTEALREDHFYEKDSLYTLRQVTVRHGCVREDLVRVPVFTLKIPNVITPGLAEGKNDSFIIQYGQGTDPVKTPFDFGYSVSVKIFNRWGDLVYKNDDYKNDWTADDQAAGVYYYLVEVQGTQPCKSWVHVMK